MKTLYIECKMGVAGDMLTSALLGLFEDKDLMVDRLNSLQIPGIKYELEQVRHCGILGDYLKVTVNGAEEESIDAVCGDGALTAAESAHHHDDAHHSHDDHHYAHEGAHSHAHHREHRSVADVMAIVDDLKLEDAVKKDIREVYGLLSEAESAVHGEKVEEIHFHEVGQMDAIADITAVCYLINELGPEKILVSPINVGSGQVRCAHGILPVPAPATLRLLHGMKFYEDQAIRAELTTPTGAALVKHFCTQTDCAPLMTVQKTGYGMGKKEFDKANCVRAMLGEGGDELEDIIQLSCNIDDMTPEELSFAMQKLYNAGAVEAFTVPVGMKKGRTGALICCLCHEKDKDEVVRQLFKHTSTLGIRENVCKRHVLKRDITTLNTPYGEVRCKTSSGYGVVKSKLEYDDLAGIAEKTGKSISEIRKNIEKSEFDK